MAKRLRRTARERNKKKTTQTTKQVTLEQIAATHHRIHSYGCVESAHTQKHVAEDFFTFQMRMQARVARATMQWKWNKFFVDSITHQKHTGSQHLIYIIWETSFFPPQTSSSAPLYSSAIVFLSSHCRRVLSPCNNTNRSLGCGRVPCKWRFADAEEERVPHRKKAKL